MSGCPIRKSSDQRLFAPTRSLSQLITSFIASQSLGIHRSLLFCFLYSFLLVCTQQTHFRTSIQIHNAYSIVQHCFYYFTFLSFQYVKDRILMINCQLLIINWMSHDMSSNVLIVSVSLLKTSLFFFLSLKKQRACCSFCEALHFIFLLYYLLLSYLFLIWWRISGSNR